MSRITVTLPANLLTAADRKLARPGESRSAFVRRVLEDALHEAQEREDVERYIQGYTEHPQHEEEFGWSDPVAREGLAEVSWE